MLIFTLEIRTLRHRKDKQIVQGHTDNGRFKPKQSGSRDLSPSNLALELVLFPQAILLSWSPLHLSFHFSSFLSHLSLRLSTVSHFTSYLYWIPCMYLCRFVWPLLPPGSLSTCLVLGGEPPYPQVSPCPPSMVDSLSAKDMPWHGTNHTFPGKRHGCSSAKV